MLNKMFKKVDFRRAIVTGLIAAILFCIPVAIFIKAADYTRSWLLYMGSFLFLAVSFYHTLKENAKRGQNESTVALVFVSHVTTVIGVLFSTLFCFILLSILVPGYLAPGTKGTVMALEPAQMDVDNTDGLSFAVYMAATIINFSVGSFAGIVLSFYAKQNQTKDSREPTPLHQGGTK
jgi:F0F1-type ATP synthase membrane subunit a